MRTQDLEQDVAVITSLGFSLEFMGESAFTSHHGWSVYIKRKAVVVKWIMASSLAAAVAEAKNWVLATAND